MVKPVLIAVSFMNRALPMSGKKISRKANAVVTGAGSGIGRAFALELARRGGIINVCSAASFAAAPLMGPYNVAKAAVLALSETLKAELAGAGVHVTALCPTWVKTNIVQDGRIPGGTSKMAQRMMEWLGHSPESVAALTLDSLDRNRLYVLPQLDARLVWRLKRYAPVSYNRGSGLIARFMAP
ncbi:MAG: SDR family NAD(P)-dependent oxidoreductase [Pseudomonadota bacterium]